MDSPGYRAWCGGDAQSRGAGSVLSRHHERHQGTIGSCPAPIPWSSTEPAPKRRVKPSSASVSTLLLLISLDFKKILLKFCYFNLKGFSADARGEEPACQCRRHKRPGLHPWVGKNPWRRAGRPTPVFLPGESHGQRSWVGYGP